MRRRGQRARPWAARSGAGAPSSPAAPRLRRCRRRRRTRGGVPWPPRAAASAGASSSGGGVGGRAAGAAAMLSSSSKSNSICLYVSRYSGGAVRGLWACAAGASGPAMLSSSSKSNSICLYVSRYSAVRAVRAACEQIVSHTAARCRLCFWASQSSSAPPLDDRGNDL